MYFNSPVGCVDWDDYAGAVYLRWKQFAEGEEFRAVVSAGLNLLLEKQATKWLGDLRDLGPVTQEDQRWSAESWFPRAAAGGMAYLALVLPRRIVAQMAVKTFLNKVNDRRVLIGNFDELEQARSWLREQQ